MGGNFNDVGMKTTRLFNKNCQIPDLPTVMRWSGGGLLDSKPTICGGQTNTGAKNSKECFSLENNGQWEKSASLPTFRWGHHGVVIRPDNDTLWLTGGKIKNKGTKTTYLVGAVNGPGPGMPGKGMQFHCTVATANGSVILTGGLPTQFEKKTHVYNWVSNGLEYGGTGPELNERRSSHGCSAIISKNHGNREVVLVVGEHPNDDISTAEIWDYQTPGATWELCKYFSLKKHHELSD